MIVCVGSYLRVHLFLLHFTPGLSLLSAQSWLCVHFLLKMCFIYFFALLAIFHYTFIYV